MKQLFFIHSEFVGGALFMKKYITHTLFLHYANIPDTLVWHD
ncbi:Mobile element protein [Lactiplantibacillus plantarum]|uniref:Mobile element protein n=1 Tax=Lactiplantibacillus plantarum TaxID=1590 RepID=A0AAW3RCB2_LACPN|nr:Mobile element protein [Lactiplantibacillus plantarum]